jgi:hypothetical protein
MEKPRIPNGMNIPDNFSKSLEAVFQFLGLKILKFFDADPGSGIFLTLDRIKLTFKFLITF